LGEEKWTDVHVRYSVVRTLSSRTMPTQSVTSDASTVNATITHVTAMWRSRVAGCLNANTAFSITYTQTHAHQRYDTIRGSRVVSVLDSGAEGPRFKSQPRRRRVMQSQANCSHPSRLGSPSSKIGSSHFKGCGGNCRPGGK